MMGNDGWLATYNGKRIYPFKLSTDDIDVVDIAHKLSTHNRYGGASKFPYSVAQHSILMAQKAKEDGYSNSVQLCMLCHDMHEAFFPGDLSRIMKINYFDEPVVNRCMEMDKDNENIVRAALWLPDGDYCWDIVKIYDTRILVDEKKALFPQYKDISNYIWGIPKGVQALNVKIREWHWEYTKNKFLDMFNDLYKNY